MFCGNTTQVIRFAVLYLGSVEPCVQHELGRVADLFTRHDPGADAAAVVEILADRQRVIELVVADAAFVEAGVAEDVLQRIGFGDVPPALANDQRELALVVEVG